MAIGQAYIGARNRNLNLIIPFRSEDGKLFLHTVTLRLSDLNVSARHQAIFSQHQALEHLNL